MHPKNKPAPPGGMSIAAQVAAGFSLLYVVAYLINSANGGYWRKPVIGNTRYEFGLGMPTLFLWQPRLGCLAPNDHDALGIIFYPMILIDRGLFHKNLDLNNEKDEKIIFSKTIKLHPTLKTEP